MHVLGLVQTKGIFLYTLEISVYNHDQLAGLIWLLPMIKYMITNARLLSTCT